MCQSRLSFLWKYEIDRPFCGLPGLTGLGIIRGSIKFHPTFGRNSMIQALKDDSVFERMGGQFKFTSLVQHRMRELMEGARPLVERQGRSDLEIAIQEVVEGKITYVFDGESGEESTG